MKKRTTITFAIGILTLAALTGTALRKNKPELEMQTFGAQIDQIMSKTTVIAEVEVQQEKL
ncbi:MAG: hypothetical protein EP326_08685 [Deltaproteobacteria bacterium]|nr:MAG: hypothetical protein EP326_08685 [Deltaproteobacteria bacterium]TNF29133.1 MAG: hypothetical protein EP319_07615 [Deltaproteobacteria bacterium]